MFSHTTFGIFFGILVTIAIIPDATSYSKYGRTCKDIGCRSDETCVMAEDPCYGSHSDQCGRYPTCKRISDVSCTTTVCGQNEYCKSENGAPKCVRKSTGLEYDEMQARIPTQQSNYPTETETRPRGSSDTSNLNGQSYLTGSSGYPSGLGYPSRNGYPSSGSSGYPSSQSSAYPSSGSSGYPSSGSSGYPSNPATGSGYPNGHSGSSGYPGNFRNPYNEGSVGRTGASSVNAGYPSYPRTSAYPDGNPSYRGNYPNQNSGYPSNYPYGNQHLPNQGNSNGYPQNYPQGYQNQNYMTTTKKPGFREQLTNIARNVAERVLTQAIVDRVTGRHS
ncbi:probable ATP-dependent RNA helicase ddx17 isoform X2 [Linepithema humile]|nr:PREDICTED: uncharacterized protein CG42266-like isoform X2 [Linepithema humile]XP_012226075.1 PREDICTED: uncharacterized protein CG42266-like isoform X2 [Linepithema humile]